MKRIYVTEMPDGSKWSVPAEIIADHRARHYAEHDPDTTYEEEYGAMIGWFDSKDFEFEDWAQNNMSWDDVKDHASLLPGAVKQIDWQDGWMNGEHEYLTIGD